MSGQRSNTTEIACESAAYVIITALNVACEGHVFPGKTFKRIAILRFYRENILTKPRACVMIFPASDKCSFAAIIYLGV